MIDIDGPTPAAGGNESTIMAYLKAANGPQNGAVYQLQTERTRMGRHPDCEILADSSGSVSRLHAEITNRDGGFFLQDSNSRNGTFVNGQMLNEPQQLVNEDVIQICDLVFVFHDESQEGTSALGPARPFPIPAVVVRDDDQRSSIMSRLEVSSSGGMVHVRATADAKLRAMMELSESLASALSVDEVLTPVLDSLFKVFLQTDSGFIVLKDDDETWRPRCAKFRKAVDDQVRISRSIVQLVMDDREAVLSADAAEDSRFQLSESIAHLRIRSFICSPLIDSDGRVVGAIQIDTEDGDNRYDEEDLELVASIASQAAIAIQRAQLHDDVIQAREIQAELEIARRVQLQLLPDQRPDCPSYSFYEYYQAANKIGGDYYDYVPMRDGRLAVILADVSGHGVAAAMVMTKLAAEARFCLATTEEPKDVVAQLNRLLCVDNVDGRFVTMVLMVLDPEQHRLTIVNAGHSHPILRTQDGVVRTLPGDKAGFLLGIVDGAEYDHEVVSLDPGDIVVVYTDGITEAIGVDGELYGTERLTQALEKTESDLTQQGQSIVDDAYEFIGDGAQTDDICLLCLKRDE